MFVGELEKKGGSAIWGMDSIASIAPAHEGCVVVTGSHGGQSAGEYALKFPLRAVLFNDAGIGKDEAGVVALAMLQAKAIPAAAIAHTTGRIGDALDMWQHGYLSRVNAAAAEAGLEEGMSAREAARLVAKL
ncbi:MAG: hypothetical protein AB7R90_15030 [Reyranellaceae bacterium]